MLRLERGCGNVRINNTVGNVSIKIDTSRINKNIREAQKLLNLAVVGDCDPLIPFQQGALRNSVTFPQGVYGGEIEYNTPYAHYLYQGEVYGPNIPIRDAAGNITGWYSPPKKNPTGRPLTYHTAGTGDHWFEKAKEQHKQEWIDLVKRTAGKE